MRWRQVLGLSAMALALSGLAQAGDTVLVLSSNEPEYLAVAAGFKSNFSGNFREIGLEGSDTKQRAVGEELKAAKPGLAVVVGDLAAQMAQWYLAGVPMIYCQASQGAKLSLAGGKVVSIYHEPDPSEQLKILPGLFPGKTRVGLFFSPEYAKINRPLLKKQSQELGLTLEMIALNSIQEVPGKLRELLPKVDVLWVFTDPVILSSHSIQYLVLQAVSSGVPIFCGDNALARRGATAAMVPDFEDVGRQAAQAAAELAQGKGAQKETILYPKGRLILNQKIAGLLKLSFPAPLLSQAQELIH